MPSEGNKMQLNKEEYKNFKQIVNIFYNEEIEGINEDKEKIKKEGTIKIEPRIFYDKFSGDMKIEFKIGNKKMYKIKNLSDIIYNVLLILGTVIAVIVGSVLGIQFITGSVEQKAKVKDSLIPFVIGCVVIFGAFGIWKLVITILR